MINRIVFDKNDHLQFLNVLIFAQNVAVATCQRLCVCVCVCPQAHRLLIVSASYTFFFLPIQYLYKFHFEYILFFFASPHSECPFVVLRECACQIRMGIKNICTSVIRREKIIKIVAI